MCPAADSKVLRTAIKTRTFGPAYYLYGEDDYLKDEELKRLTEAAVDSATRDFNFEVLRAGDIDAETLGSLIATPPMMADRRVLVIRDVTALKKDARLVLDKYLGSPAPDLLLILLGSSGAKPDAKLVKFTNAIGFEPLTGNRVPKWIVYYVEHELKSTITADAVTLLQEAAGTELGQLRVELDKLANFTTGNTIDAAAIAAVVGVQRGETMGDLLDAIARRDVAAALEMLPIVLQQPKNSAVTIVMALTAQTLALGWAQAGRDDGLHPGKLNGELFGLLKASGSVYTGRSWGEFVTTCARASAGWTAREIDDALGALLDADAGLKDTRISSDEQLLATLVLRLCGPSGKGLP